MASVLKVDEMQGVTSAGDITITGEGGSATMQLQQGLAKAWASRTSAATPATNDSFNIASLTDGGTGDTEYNLSSAMNNDGGACACANQSTASDFGLFGDWKTTSKLRTLSRNSSGTDTDRAVTIMGTGDLA
jgi:hypothetical protein